MKNKQVYFCPSGRDRTNAYMQNYGVNWDVCRDFRKYGPVREADITKAAETFMWLDCGAYMAYRGYVLRPSGFFWYVPGTGVGRDPTALTPYPLTGGRAADLAGWTAQRRHQHRLRRRPREVAGGFVRLQQSPALDTVVDHPGEGNGTGRDPGRAPRRSDGLPMV